jgi:hypothetical protein
LPSPVADTPFSIYSSAAKYGLKHAIERIAVLIAASVVMMQMWRQVSAGINGPGWSLCVETVFYLSFPVDGQWLWKVNKRRVWIATSLFYAVEVAVSAAVDFAPLPLADEGNPGSFFRGAMNQRGFGEACGDRCAVGHRLRASSFFSAEGLRDELRAGMAGA